MPIFRQLLISIGPAASDAPVRFGSVLQLILANRNLNCMGEVVRFGSGSDDIGSVRFGSNRFQQVRRCWQVAGRLLTLNSHFVCFSDMSYSDCRTQSSEIDVQAVSGSVRFLAVQPPLSTET